MKEVFKSIDGYPDYEVSNFGRVKSFKRSKPIILKPFPIGKGYPTVRMANKKYKTIKISQLVAMAFLNHTPCGHKIVVDHINGDKTNNNLYNLQLITNRENSSKDRKGGTSKYISVSWYKNSNKWESNIYINGKRKRLGYFNCELAAAKAYQQELLKQ